MQNKYILITRPEEQAGPLIESVRARGYIPLVEPMLAIGALADVALPDLSGYQALIFTSANGVRACAALTADRSHPVYVVGPQTYKAAREAGWSHVHSPEEHTGAAGLAIDLAARDWPDDRALLHLSGEDIAGPLCVEGLRIERIALYKAEPAVTLSDETLAALDRDLIAAVLFYSPRTARIFNALLHAYGRTCAASAIKALCISPAVLESFDGLLWQDVRVAPSADGEGVTSLLHEL